MKLLPHKTVHIWLADRRTLGDSVLEEKYRGWLSDEEKARLKEIRSPEYQRQQLQARAMVRWCLSQYSDSVTPSKWRIARDLKGKPHLVDSYLPLSFSLSHSGDWLALAITNDTEVGLDIENQTRNIHWRAVAQRYFAQDEIASLDEIPEAILQRERFFAFWTLKEAYFKAHGGGIATGLHKIRFQIDNNGAITAEFSEGLDDDVKTWQFHHYHLGENYCLSLALKQPHAQDAAPHFYKTIPGEIILPLAQEAHRVIPH